MSIKAVFIDIDDTLLSFSGYVRQAMKDGFRLFGLKPYEEEMFPIFERVNNGLWRELEKGELTFEELIKVRWNRIFKELGIDFDGVRFETFFREQLHFSAVPEEGAMELLSYLAGKYVLCAASNGPYEQQMNRLRVGNMEDSFRHFFISSKIGAQKPSREFFDACFAELRETEFPELRAEETIIIGDSLTSDISGGTSYGMHTCHYRKKPLQNAETSTAEYTVDKLLDIIRIL